ncbi:hypothetical protein BDF19DRAFT_14911 [Syncephalis fuscata]|nr:hypothetical protein BDF19DRAFT_14911 [Syncephalis fuscata]
MSDSAASVKRTLDASESIEHKRSRPEESLVATTVATELSGLTREINAGIVAYIKKDAPGFSAIIKHRTYDFMVFEIDNEDQPVHLTSMALPDTKKTSKTTTESELLDDKEKEKEPVDVYKQLGAYIGIEASEQLRSMVESKGKEPTEVLAPAKMPYLILLMDIFVFVHSLMLKQRIYVVVSWSW